MTEREVTVLHTVPCRVVDLECGHKKASIAVQGSETKCYMCVARREPYGQHRNLRVYPMRRVLGDSLVTDG